MEIIKEITKLQEECEKKGCTDNIKNAYFDLLQKYFVEHSVTQDIISKMIKCVNIDNCECFKEYLKNKDTKSINDIINSIEKNKDIIKPKNNEAYVFVYYLIWDSLFEKNKLSKFNDRLISLYANMFLFKKYKQNDVENKLIELIKTLADRMHKDLWPKMHSLPISTEAKRELITKFINCAESYCNESKYNEIRNWLSGEKMEIELIADKEKTELKFPESKISKLKEITEFYFDLENQYKNLIIKNEKLEKDIIQYEDGKNKLIDNIKNLNLEIEELKLKLNNCQDKLNDTEGKHKKLIEFSSKQDEFRVNSEKILLQDIANELKEYYADFLAMKKDSDDKHSKEYYLGLISAIFENLNSKGVKFNV